VSLLSELRVMRASFQETTDAIMETIEKPVFTDAVRKSMAAMMKSPNECGRALFSIYVCVTGR
jgi:hypothetical protein